MPMKIIESLAPTKTLGFGQVYCPLMATARYQGGQWTPCEISKTQPITIDLGAKVFHYAQEIFEGCKVYKQVNGKVAFFRPLDNIRRMSRSAQIMSMPPFPEEEFMRVMQELVSLSKNFVPESPGALYIRPTMIGTTPTLGVAPAQEFLFFILLSPVGGYFGDVNPEQPASIDLWVSPHHVRAVRGGLGAAKTGANYAASLSAVGEAKRRGYTNVLFLDAIERRYVEELSGMNFFIVESGVLKTPQLKDTILDGVTRKAIIDIAKHLNISVQESDLDIDSLLKGIENGSITEAFACGTAASITRINKFSFKDTNYSFNSQETGPITQKLYSTLLNIQSGKQKPVDPSWIVEC